MKKLIFLFLLTIPVFSQDTLVVIDTLSDGGIVHTTYINGMAEGPRTYYLNGNKHVISSMSQGQQEGREYWFFPNGNIKIVVDFSLGYYHGIFERYSETGELLYKHFYFYGSEVSEEEFNKKSER